MKKRIKSANPNAMTVYVKNEREEPEEAFGVSDDELFCITGEFMCAYSTARRRLTPSEGSGACDFRPRPGQIFFLQQYFFFKNFSAFAPSSSRARKNTRRAGAKSIGGGRL